MLSHAEINCAAAAIDDRTCARHQATCILHYFDRFASRSASSDNVFHHQDLLALPQTKAPSKRHHPCLAFREESTHSERASSLVSYNYSADRRGYHEIDSLVFEIGGKRLANVLRVFGILEDERALQITRAVQPRCKLKVTFQQRARLLKDFEKVFVFTSHRTTRRESGARRRRRVH